MPLLCSICTMSARPARASEISVGVRNRKPCATASMVPMVSVCTAGDSAWTDSGSDLYTALLMTMGSATSHVSTSAVAGSTVHNSAEAP